MDTAQRLRAQLERRVRDATPTLAAEILRAWDRLAAELSEAKLARIIASGNAEQVFAELLTPELLDRVFGEVRRAMFAQTTESMAFHAKQLGKGVGIGFGVLSPEVIEGIRKIDVKMADSLKDDVRDLVRAYVENGIRDGVNPRTTARAIRAGVGLTDKQLAWVDNFRAELEAGKRSALNRALGRGVFTKPDGSLGFKPGHAGGVGIGKRDMELMRRTLGTDARLTTPQINRLVGQYQKRLTAWHSETLARTAALDAQKAGQHFATKQAIADGILDAERMVSEWLHVGDSRVREEHDFHEVVPFDTPFRTGEVIPGESTYNCRCIKRDYQERAKP